MSSSTSRTNSTNKNIETRGGIENFERKVSRMLLFFFPTFIVIIYFVFRETDFKILLRKIDLKYVFVLLALMVIAWLLSTVKFILVVKLTRGKISFRRALDIVLAGIFGSNITPFYTGGIASQTYFLVKFAESIGRSTAISVIYFILTLTVSFIFAIILIFIPHGFITGLRSDFAYSVAIIVIAWSGIALFFMKFPQKAKFLIKLFIRVVLKRQPDLVKLDKGLNDFSEGLRYFFSQNKLQLLLILFVSFLTQLTSMFLTPAAFLVLGIPFPFKEVFITQIAVQFTASIGFTPGGIGIIEGAYAGLFYPFASASIALLTFVYRLAYFYIPTIVGAFFFYKLLREERSAFKASVETK